MLDNLNILLKNQEGYTQNVTGYGKLQEYFNMNSRWPHWYGTWL